MFVTQLQYLTALNLEVLLELKAKNHISSPSLDMSYSLFLTYLKV